MGRFIGIIAIVIITIFLMGTFPAVAVSVTALGIVFMFLIFGD